jgi:N-acetylmannosamine-6-phosphate 2-epimerase/N-acetylmannosamine kinase
MKSVSELIQQLDGKLIVSCQAAPGDAFYGPDLMARFATAAVDGGAAGIRASWARDVAAIATAVPGVPIIGIWKEKWTDGCTLITPRFEQAQELVGAGASIIALDCTTRGCRFGALERLTQIRAELGVPVMADVATIEEALAAAEAGADFVAPTMRGYTDDTRHTDGFDVELVREMVRAVAVPVIAEGRIATPEQARQAVEAGALAVVVGTVITRPRDITQSFAAEVARAQRRAARTHYLAIDLGGTNTKFGVVSSAGELVFESVAPTPAAGGRDALLSHLKTVANACLERARGWQPAALGIATAGWVDTRTGSVAYATENLPGWTGTRIADELSPVVGLPVGVENDANALALGEKRFGLGRGVSDFVCVTLGTGIGGGCYIGGALNRGKHSFANALGHITLKVDGEPCTCGRRGCLEAYANSAALLRYAGGSYSNAEAVISAANSGDAQARAAIEKLARYLAAGLASIVQILDPELLVLSGGLVQSNQILLDTLRERLAAEVIAWPHRTLRVELSKLGYFGGLYGAAAIGEERLTLLRRVP